MRILIAVTALVLAVGCGTTGQPSPSAGNLDDVVANLVLRGFTVHRLISGDAGCQAATLHDNAVHLITSLSGDPQQRDVYLLRWRRASDFDASRDSFEVCVAQFTAAHPESQVTTLDSRPWRAFGRDWPAQFRDAFAAALKASGGA